MASVTKEKLREIFIKRFNVSKSDYQIIDKILDELYDLDRKIVPPFTEFETEIFRKRYGIYTSGQMLTGREVEEEYNLIHEKSDSILSVCISKLAFRINKMEKRVKIPKISSFDIRGGDDLEISSLNLNSNTINLILRHDIYTLRELLEYSKIELKRIIAKKKFEEIVEYIHSLGYLFIDELSIGDQKTLIVNSEVNTVYNSSIYLINSVKDIDIRLINSMDVKNIGEFIVKIDYLSRNEKAKVLKDIMLERINLKPLEDYSEDELYNSNLIILGISKDIYDTFKKFGIEKVIELVSYNVGDIQKILRDNVKAKSVIDKVHNFNLLFKDEAELLKYYTENIEEDIKNIK